MVNVYSFRGGVRISAEKNTIECRTETLPVPSVLKVRVGAIGACVSVGDHVLRGQIIGDTDNPDLCPVRSPAEGDVTGIDADASGAVSVTVAVSGGNSADPSIRPFDKKLSQTTTAEIVEKVREAGVTGSGKDAGPVHVKIRDAAGKVKRVIVDCTGNDPFITVNEHLAAENAAGIINGIKIVMRALGVERAVIAVDENNVGAVNSLREKIGSGKYIKVAAMKRKYPQGDGRNLVRAVLGRDLPAGKSPVDAGCAVFNAETCVHIFRALAEGEPMTEKYMTVDGDCVKRPGNLLVPAGTAVSELFAFCGGLKKEPARIVAGGAVNGTDGCSPETAVDCTVDGVLAFSEAYSPVGGRYACIRCGRCVSACPEHLLPFELFRLTVKGKKDKAVKIGLECCTECGACAYVCPGKLPLVGMIRDAKNGLTGSCEEEMCKPCAGTEADAHTGDANGNPEITKEITGDAARSSEESDHETE